MIRLPDKSLKKSAQNYLQKWQAKVDEIPTFEERSAKAKNLFSGKNKKGNKTFEHVKEVLEQMCSGARRCCYCEDSLADEVEHIFPKSIFPEKVFVWENYLYACGPCNGPKNNQFAIFPQGKNEIFQCPDGVKPPEGESVFINPRSENPELFLELDLLDTFFFVEIPEKGTREFKRAEYTWKVLDLNRDVIAKARKGAFRDYKNALELYVKKKEDHDSEAELLGIKKGILEQRNPAVWLQMQLQHKFHPELKDLFERAPEALTWRREM
ncbi:MAG: hypothetical protein H6581_12935 [Bacteroidia bacterium]|nr:hypothetical protein [Bacteroidia bacterium]